MKTLFTAAYFIICSNFCAQASLSHLLDCDPTTCLEQLENASEEQLWNVFLEGQAELFFEPEFRWIAKGPWWKKAKNILEMGSGNGSYLYRLSREFNDKVFKGIEKLSQSVKQARERYEGNNLIFMEGDAEVFEEQLTCSADLILFRLTLQHLKDPLTALKNAAMYLASGGFIVIIDSCDHAKKTSHPIPIIDETLKALAELQKSQGKGNRKVTMELLQLLNEETSELSQFFKVVYSNLDKDGNVIDESIRFEGKERRDLYFNHRLLFLTLVSRTYHIPIDFKKAYDELKDYYNDESAWSSPGVHFLVLKASSNSASFKE